MRNLLIAAALLCALSCAQGVVTSLDAETSATSDSSDTKPLYDVTDAAADLADVDGSAADSTDVSDQSDASDQLGNDLDQGDQQQLDEVSCDPCTADAVRCKEGALEKCGDNGCGWTLQTACAAGCLSETACKNCEFETLRCGPGGDIERCNESTNGRVFQTSCQLGCGVQHAQRGPLRLGLRHPSSSRQRSRRESTASLNVTGLAVVGAPDRGAPGERLVGVAGDPEFAKGGADAAQLRDGWPLAEGVSGDLLRWVHIEVGARQGVSRTSYTFDHLNGARFALLASVSVEPPGRPTRQLRWESRRESV